MLFNSHIFILLFLPFFLFSFFSSSSQKIRSLIIVGFSFSFYLFWSLRDFALLLASIIFNYGVGWWINKSSNLFSRRASFIFSICANLLYLSYFKYGFSRDVNGTLLIMPLAISFYTFEQIIFQYEIFSKKVKKINFLDYLIFISFFPRLISGPIYYFSQYRDKFHIATKSLINYENLCLGLGVFTFGLFKKVIIADKLAIYVDSFYQNDSHYSSLDGWFCTLAYTFQIYFDFSGYSEMALGIGLMIGILLPINFNSPYQATSINDFWSRWHISLSKMIRDYIYIPLGGNQKSGLQKFVNLLVTMSICGMWHGSTINFLIWGFCHGIFISLNHLLKNIPFSINPFLAQIGTFSIIHMLWIPFRSESMSQSGRVIKKLFIDMHHSLTFSFGKRDLVFLILVAFSCFFLPNVLSLFLSEEKKIYSFQPNYTWMIIILITFLISFTGIGHVSPFLYFNF